VYTYHRYRDTDILDEAGRDVERGAERFFFLYLSEIDAFLHQHRTDDARIEEKFAWYERRLRDLLARARMQDSRAEMTILSDHGMAPVRRHHDLARDINELGLTMPRDYLAVYDSTMARFWFFSETARRQVTERVGGFGWGGLVWVGVVVCVGLGFGVRGFGEVVLLMDAGWLITSSDFNTNGWLPTGMHGYHPDDPDSDAIFLSSREPSRTMRTIADAHAVMRDAAAIGRQPEESTAR
jgi:predicted AlkP superfamily pyrophosphatase or phosphodiesterase